ncbi:MarR family transcriptional regulator [Dehalobacter sp. DCM]|uniref:MarR family winged helix-turn-helix transcriptional regulator n=1 Tax=Dehalobacter sp. DCM TaxID=2907827 RepID=UPI0030817733|nr:MarR family transcriptional regulator [Dehalobacter sp. DCM]
MDPEKQLLEDTIFQFIDRIKPLISNELWANVLMNATKNELLVLLLVYRQEEATMSQVAQYLRVPLNTATGIISRMEKEKLLSRERNDIDKRVVTIRLSESGRTQIRQIINTFMDYGQKLLADLTPEETVLIFTLIEKVISMLQKEQFQANSSKELKVRKIIIE